MSERFDIESMMKKIPDRYKLVIAATQRARALNLGEKPLVDTKFKNNALIALEELSKDKLKLSIKAPSKTDEKEKKK